LWQKYVILALLTGEDVVRLFVGISGATAVAGFLDARSSRGGGGDAVGTLVSERLLLLRLLLVELWLLLHALLLLLGSVVVENTAALVRAFGALRVPLQAVLTHELLHCVAANVLAVQSALSHAWTIAEDVTLVLRHAGAAEVHVALRHWFGLEDWLFENWRINKVQKLYLL